MARFVFFLSLFIKLEFPEQLFKILVMCIFETDIQNLKTY